MVLATTGTSLTSLAVNLHKGKCSLSSQRTREFGICMALGASKGRILRSLLAWGLRQIAIGVSFGLLLALPAAFLFWHLLRSPRVFDWSTDAIAALALTVAALCAYYVPARRATRVDPMLALRHE
jgi:putative ABC transport system permease protein